MPVRSVKMKLKDIYDRITLTRITTAFFAFTFVHCLAQGIIQLFLYSIDSDFQGLVSSMIKEGDIPPKTITYYDGHLGHLRLRMCNEIPYGMDPCFDIIDGPKNNTIEQLRVIDDLSGLAIKPIRDSDNVTLVIGLQMQTHDGNTLFIEEQCIQMLVNPRQTLQSSEREDLVFILLQFWLFGISFFAILHNSVPHILAVLVTRSLVTAWSMFSLWRTKNNRAIWLEFQTDTCSVDFFRGYFRTRFSYQIPDLILNVVALLIACYLSWVLLKIYSAQSFKCVGAPKHIHRINKFFMATLACLQLEAFVLTTAMALWVDVLINTSISLISTHTKIYHAAFIFSTIILVPWVTMGWYAIRREMNRMMMVFLIVGFIIISCWSIMFYSQVYRWTFMQWPLFGCFVVASLALIFASMFLGVICRMNFCKGLAEYLHAEAALASVNFSPGIFSVDESKDKMNDIPEKSYRTSRCSVESAEILPTLAKNSTFP